MCLCSTILPFHAAFHHLSQWMRGTRDPEETSETKWAPAPSACNYRSLPLGVRQNFVILNVRPQTAQSGSKQIHKSFVYTWAWSFPIRSWQRVLLEEAHRRYVRNCQGWNESDSLCGVYDTTTAIDGELLMQTKQKLIRVSAQRTVDRLIKRNDWLGGDWPVTLGCGHPRGRRSCWMLCWTFRCSVCVVRWWPGSPTIERRF